MDELIYAFHALFWSAFAIRYLVRVPERANAPSVPASAPVRTAPFSRGLVFVHNAGFFVLYFGIGAALFSPAGPVTAARWLAWQEALGAAIVLLGAALGAWALMVFRSWRLRAQLDAGHELATSGPFALVRHPIYVSLDLLALGTLAWLPTPIVAAGAAIVVLGGVVRARAEERLMLEAFGDTYRDYMKRVAGFVPWVC